jgi:hypothetical protein
MLGFADLSAVDISEFLPMNFLQVFPSRPSGNISPSSSVRDSLPSVKCYNFFKTFSSSKNFLWNLIYWLMLLEDASFKQFLIYSLIEYIVPILSLFIFQRVSHFHRQSFDSSILMIPKSLSTFVLFPVPSLPLS